jgi:hypothetical protein
MAVERAAPYSLGVARACALVGTAALVGGAALALWARSRAAAGPARRVLLLDLSHSVRARWRDPGAVYARLAEARGPAQPIAFGADVVRCTPGELRGLARTLDGSRSELDAALEVARAALGPEGERTIEILSDGGFTGADPRPRLSALEREGVGLQWLALPERERAELVLGEPRAGEARVGAPVALELPLALEACAADPGPRSLSIEVEHAGASTRSARELAAPAGPGWVSWPLRLELGPLEPGETRVRFSLPGEPLSLRELVLVPEGSRARAAVLGPALGLAQVAGGPEWIAVDAARLARELDGFDLLLSTDASFAELPRAALAAWLARGGAWIACAAPRNFPQEWAAQDLAALLPLAPAGEGLPPRDVIFLLDGSGSMVGEPWNSARAALQPLADAAGAGERLFVRSFAGALGPAQPLGPGAPAANAPGGPTALCDSLAALAREPSERERLVVLLSDGKDRGGPDAPARAAELARTLAGARITLAPIAVGADANVELLRALASPGQELLSCTTLASGLEALFRRQLGARQWARDLPGLAASRAADAALGSAFAGLVLDRPLARCAALRAREGAEVVLATPERKPALALRRVGLGWCAAAAFDPSQTAIDPWNTLAQFLAREPAGRRPRLVLRPGRLRVENLEADAAGWTRAELRDPDGRAELALAARDGGLEAELPAQLERRAWQALVLRPGSAGELSLPWPKGLPAEERLPRPELDPGERRDRPAQLVPRAGAQAGLSLALVGAGLLFSFLGAALGFFSRARGGRGNEVLGPQAPGGSGRSVR